MSYTTEELSIKVKDCIGKLLNETSENYREGRNRAAWAIVDWDHEHGRILLVQWPNDNTIDVNWSPETAGVGDLGTLIGSVSTEYFGIEPMVALLANIIKTFKNE